MEPITSSYIDAALSLFQISENTNAITLLNKALSIDPKNSRALVILGLLYQDSGKAEKAEKAFRKALKYEPENLDAHKGFGLFLLSQDRIEESLEYLLKYIRLGQWEDIPILNTIRSLYEEATNQDEIAKTLEESWIKSLNPKVGYLHFDILQAQKLNDQALEIITLLAHHTNKHEYFNLLGIILSNLGRNQEAINAAQKAIDLASTYIDEHVNEIDQSVETNSALLFFPTYLYNLAYYYLQTGEMQQALNTIEHSILHDSENPLLWEFLVKTLILLEQYDRAYTKVQEAINRFNNYGEARRGLYRLLIEVLDLSKSYKQYSISIQEARKIFPDDFTWLAIKQLMEEGNYAEAIKLLEEANKNEVIHISSEDTEISELISLLYFHGDIEQARKLIKRYIVPGSEENQIDILTLDAYDYVPDEDAEKQEKGLDFLKFIQAIFPNSFTANNELIDIYIGKEDYRKAEEILIHLLDHTPVPHQHAVTLNNLGYIYLLTGQHKKAITYFEKLIALNLAPSDINFSDRLGIALWKEGKGFPDYQSSQSAGALQLVPFRNLSPALAGRANLITLALATGDTKKAERWAMEFISADVSGLGFKLLGYVYLAKGELENAVWAWRIALEKSAQPEYTDLLIPEALEALIAEYSAK